MAKFTVMRERRHTLPLPLGDEIPFSKGLMARALVVTGLDPERAYLIARYGRPRSRGAGCRCRSTSTGSASSRPS